MGTQEADLADKMGHCQHTSKERWLPCPCSCRLLRRSCSWPRLLQQKVMYNQPRPRQSFWLPDGLCSLYACATSSSMHDSIGRPASPLPRTPVLTWRPKSAECHVGTVQHAAL